MAAGYNENEVRLFQKDIFKNENSRKFCFFIKTESFWQNQRVIPKNHLVASTNQPDRNEIPSGFWCEMRKSFYIGYRHSGIDFENPADET